MINYLPDFLGEEGFEGALLPLPVPDGLPVVLGAFAGLLDVFAIADNDIIIVLLFRLFGIASTKMSVWIRLV